MKLVISFKNIDASKALTSFIQDKSESLAKYFKGRITATWIISAEKLNRVAHCHLVGNSMDYFGEGVTDDFRASVDVALEKIETQVRKHKEIVKDHLHRKPAKRKPAKKT
jgi:putative sigma-54 modulation protein